MSGQQGEDYVEALLEKPPTNGAHEMRGVRQPVDQDDGPIGPCVWEEDLRLITGPDRSGQDPIMLFESRLLT